MRPKIHKLRIFQREGKNFGMAFGTQTPPGAPPKFRNILRVSPARRGFNGARRSLENKLEFLRLRVSCTPSPPPPPPCVYAIVTLPRLRNGSHIYTNFILLPSSESRGSLAKRTATRNSHETSDGTRRIICLVSVLSRNLAYFVLKQIALNPR